MKFVPWFKRARRGRFVDWLGLSTTGAAVGALAAKFVGSLGAEIRVASSDGVGTDSPAGLSLIFRERFAGENDRDVPFGRSRIARRTFIRAGRCIFR